MKLMWDAKSGTVRPLRKKSAAGIGVLKHRCDESRSFCSAEHAASLSVPPFMVARTGERKLHRFAQAVPGTPTRSSYRPRLALGAVVVANRTAWRPFMATLSAAACAALIPLPTRIVDALDDLECHFAAFEAVEALISAQKSGNREDLSHVDRDGLGFLLTILNVNMRQKLEAARAHADALYQLNQVEAQ